jgi:putative DNA primase/helicase
MNPNLRAALEYLKRGWNPIALCPPTHEGVSESHRRGCSHPGKSPIVGQWAPYLTNYVTENDLRLWWALHPDANVGIVCSPAFRFVGVDIDGKQGGALLSQVTADSPTPLTLSFTTGRGRRLLFRSRHATNKVLRYAEGELRILASAVTVAPPSLHQNGRRYRWVRKHGELAEAPAWLMDLPGSPPPAAVTAEGKIVEGARNGTLFRLACSARRFGFVEAGIRDVVEAGNRYCEPPLSAAEIETITRSACKYTPAAAG